MHVILSQVKDILQKPSSRGLLVPPVLRLILLHVCASARLHPSTLVYVHCVMYACMVNYYDEILYIQGVLEQPPKLLRRHSTIKVNIKVPHYSFVIFEGISCTIIIIKLYYNMSQVYLVITVYLR